MTKLKSEFTPCHGPKEHTIEFEWVPCKEEADELYVVCDGQRIAFRENKQWTSMLPGYTVFDGDENFNSIIVHFDGIPLH